MALLMLSLRMKKQSGQSWSLLNRKVLWVDLRQRCTQTLRAYPDGLHKHLIKSLKFPTL